MASRNLDSLQQGNLVPAFSYLKVTIIVVIIAVLVGGGVIGFIVYRDLQQAKSVEEDVEIASSFVPDNYYPTFNRNDIADRREQENAKPLETVVVPSVKSKGIQQQKTAEQKEAELKAQLEAEQAAKAAQTLTAEEAFLKQQLDIARHLQEQRRMLLLSRRGKKSEGWQAVEQIPTIAASSRPEPKAPTDKDFSSQEIGKDTSTFPVDLSRVVTADRHIPCILVDQINSQLEGRVVCTVESNVFGYHGRNILIPAGSKMMGSHTTLKKVGDERFNIHWTRLLRPDGAHVKLTDAYASDTVGGTGIEGVVNRRNWEKYGGALLTSTVSVLAQMSIPSEGTNISNSVFESFSTDMGRVTAAMLNENINIKPYSIVPAGTRVLVTPVTDIWLKKNEQEFSFKAMNEENQ